MRRTYGIGCVSGAGYTKPSYYLGSSAFVCPKRADCFPASLPLLNHIQSSNLYIYQVRHFSFRGNNEKSSTQESSSNKEEQSKQEAKQSPDIGSTQTNSTGYLTKPSMRALQIISFVGVGALAIASKTAITVVSFSRHSAAASPEFAIFQLFGMALVGLVLFVGSIAWVALNERRHDLQSKLRKTAKRRCIDVRNGDEFEDRVIGKRGVVKRALGIGQEDTPLLSSLHTLDQVCRVSGIVALDVGQFGDADNKAVASKPIADPAIGIPFTLKHTVNSQRKSVDPSEPLTQQIAKLESDDLLRVVASGGLSKDAVAEGSMVLALRRHVEMFQNHEQCVRNRTQDPQSSATYNYSQGWYDSQQRMYNKAATGLVLTETISHTDEEGKQVAVNTFVPLVQKSLEDPTPVTFPYRQVRLMDPDLTMGTTELRPTLGALKLFLRPKSKAQGETCTLQTLDVDPSLLSKGFTWQPLSFRDLQCPSELSDHLRKPTSIRVSREFERLSAGGFLQSLFSDLRLNLREHETVKLLEQNFIDNPELKKTLTKMQRSAEENRSQPYIMNWTSSPPSEEQQRIPSSTLRVSSCGQYLTTIPLNPTTGKELEPCIGDIRIRYEYIRATPATIVGVVKDSRREGLLKKIFTWTSSKAKGQATNTTTHALAPSSHLKAHHMPYTITRWTYEDYLDELERTKQLIKSRDEYGLSHAPVSVPKSAMSLQGAVIDLTKRQVSATFTTAALRANLMGEENSLSTEEREEIEKDRVQLESFVGSAAEKLAIFNKPIIPQWALKAVEAYLLETVPLEVISITENENATTNQMFRAHWFADTSNTWSQRFLSFSLMQGSLAAAFSLTVPLPGGIVGIGCTLCAVGVWAQTFGNAKLDIYRRRRADRELLKAKEGAS